MKQKHFYSFGPQLTGFAAEPTDSAVESTYVPEDPDEDRVKHLLNYLFSVITATESFQDQFGVTQHMVVSTKWVWADYPDTDRDWKNANELLRRGA